MERIEIRHPHDQQFGGRAAAPWQGALGRRYLLRSICKLGTVAMGLSLASPQESIAAEPNDSIPQPPDTDPAHYIERAFAMRRLAAESGDQAFGAVIVRAGKIVGQAPSRVVVNADPTAHAEMEAVRDAARRLGTRDLSNCIMYSSSRPCPMCEAAAYWADVGQLVYGAGAIIGGPPRLTRC